MLPTGRAAALLAAALPTGSRGRDALDRWLGVDPAAALVSLTAPERELLSTLCAAAERNGAVTDPEIRRTLRAARTFEEVRGPAVASACGEVLHALDDAGVRPLVVGGCSLAERLYGGWAERHCGRLELVVQAVELDLVERTLDARRLPGGTLEANHASGLPVSVSTDLHPSRRRPPRGRLPTSVVRTALIAGAPATVLADEDALVHACATAPAPWWAVDTGQLVLARVELDWRRAVAVAKGHRVALRVLARLDWLARHAGVPVPPHATASLRRQAVPQAARTLLAPRRRARAALDRLTLA